MNAISNFGAVMPNPYQQQNMAEKFSAADADQSGGLTIDEITKAADSNAIDQDRMAKMMEMADTDGNGEVSQDEMSQMMEQMKEKMSKMAGGFGAQYETQGNSFDELLKSLESDEENKEHADAAQKLRQDLDNMMQKYPAVNTFA